jgi:hypothetical protein
MGFMIKFFRIAWNNGIFQVSDDAQSNKVIVPYDIVRYHEKAKEFL